MAFQPVDRLPRWEWAMWWDKTLARWRSEGLPDRRLVMLQMPQNLEPLSLFAAHRQCLRHLGILRYGSDP